MCRNKRLKDDGKRDISAIIMKFDCKSLNAQNKSISSFTLPLFVRPLFELVSRYPTISFRPILRHYVLRNAAMRSQVERRNKLANVIDSEATRRDKNKREKPMVRRIQFGRQLRAQYVHNGFVRKAKVLERGRVGGKRMDGLKAELML